MYKTQNSLFDSQLYTGQNGRRILSDMYHQYHGLYSKNPIKLWAKVFLDNAHHVIALYHYSNGLMDMKRFMNN